MNKINYKRIGLMVISLVLISLGINLVLHDLTRSGWVTILIYWGIEVNHYMKEAYPYDKS